MTRIRMRTLIYQSKTIGTTTIRIKPNCKSKSNINRVVYTCALLLLNISFLSSTFVQASVIPILSSSHSPSSSPSPQTPRHVHGRVHHPHRNSFLQSKNSLHQDLHHRHLVIRGGAATTNTTTATNAATTTTTTSATVEGLKSSLASALAAGCSKTLLAPFDTLKTIQQNYRSTGTSLNFWQAVKLVTSRPNGIRELYAGLGVAVVGSMPSVGLYFGVYSYCKRILVPHLDTHFGPNSKHQLSSRLLFSISVTTSAAIGNTVASFSRVPYEVVKQNLQTGMYTSTWQALTEMSKQGGLRAFFPLGGVAIQMLRDIPYAMVTLLSYEILKQTMLPLKDKDRHNYPEGLVDAMTGALAGGLGSYVTNPLDVIKTRIQTNPDLYAGSIAHCTRDVWLEGGAMAFLRGSVPRLLHKIPANGFFFLFYEFFQTVLNVHVPRS